MADHDPIEPTGHFDPNSSYNKVISFDGIYDKLRAHALSKRWQYAVYGTELSHYFLFCQIYRMEGGFKL
jgi:hypothetical protein